MTPADELETGKAGAGRSPTLEAGAGGVMLSMVHGPDDVERAVRWAKFWPRGDRGMNGGNRDVRRIGPGAVGKCHGRCQPLGQSDDIFGDGQQRDLDYPLSKA